MRVQGTSSDGLPLLDRLTDLCVVRPHLGLFFLSIFGSVSIFQPYGVFFFFFLAPAFTRAARNMLLTSPASAG